VPLLSAVITAREVRSEKNEERKRERRERESREKVLSGRVSHNLLANS
jgi:hypothetical protein